MHQSSGTLFPLSLSCDCSGGSGHGRKDSGGEGSADAQRGNVKRITEVWRERRQSILSLQPSLSIEVWDSLYLGKVMGAKYIGVGVFWIAAVVKILQLAEFYQRILTWKSFFLKS